MTASPIWKRGISITDRRVYMKLWSVYNNNYPEDWWLTTANSVEELSEKYRNEFKPSWTHENFLENCTYNVIEQVDGYKVTLSKV